MKLVLDTEEFAHFMRTLQSWHDERGRYLIDYLINNPPSPPALDYHSGRFAISFSDLESVLNKFEETHPKPGLKDLFPD